MCRRVTDLVQPRRGGIGASCRILVCLVGQLVFSYAIKGGRAGASSQADERKAVAVSLSKRFV